MERGDGSVRLFEDGDFPLALGGDAAAVELPGTGIAAHLGLDGDEIFIQPAAGGVPVACNGSLLTASRWLRDGDLLRIGEHRLRCRAAADPGDGVLTLSFFEPRAAPAAPPSPSSPPRLVPPPRPPAANDLGTRIRPRPYTPPPLGGTRRVPAWLPWRTLSLAACLALMVLPAWFLFTARSVEVEIAPAAETLALGGPWPRPRVFGTWLLRPGTYRVEASREGYRDLAASFEVGPGARQSFSFTLEELPGRLAVRTEPASGATVWIDEVEAGSEPLAGVEVEKGLRQVRVAASGYVEHREAIEVEGRGARQELVVALVPLWAPVTISSRPPGARISIDGREVGATPSSQRVLAGRHRLDLRLPGFKTARREFEVEPDTPLELPTITLVEADAGLSVVSEPAGASVAVDGVYRGVTPLDLVLAPGAEHQVVIARAGYATHGEAVALAPEESRELFVELTPELGEVEVLARPAGARIWVDGEPVGAAGSVLELVAVPHQIEVRLEGYVSHRATVTPRPGFRQTLEVALETAAEARSRQIEPVVRTAQGQELRLIDGGRLQMGASRREPGRRANEALRQVEITRPFYLASHEVTNARYREFDGAHRSGQAGDESLEGDDRPVVRVTWDDAVRYCNWLSGRDSLPAFYRRAGGSWAPADPLNHGYRLPFESEWALAARVPDGKNALKYPWGEALPVPEGAGNYADAAAAGLLSSSIPGYRDGHAATAPVGSFRPNALGLFDLGGNVAEWIHDFYSLYAGATGTAQDPMGPNEGEFHVIRGASWMHDSVTELRLSYRDYGREARPDLGFRIARFLESTP